MIHVFISGHKDVTEREFEEHYKNKIDDAIKNDYWILVGESEGLDRMAQDYLYSNDAKNVIVYHLFDTPRYNAGNYMTKGGFKKHHDKDNEMTLNSLYDIAWSRRKGSGTEQNIKRREKIDKQNSELNIKFETPLARLIFLDLMESVLGVCPPNGNHEDFEVDSYGQIESKSIKPNEIIIKD